MSDELATFKNRLKLLSGIDRHELPDWFTDEMWKRFRASPAYYLFIAEDRVVLAIWHVIQRRET
jgi:hypothetical protein